MGKKCERLRKIPAAMLLINHDERDDDRWEGNWYNNANLTFKEIILFWKAKTNISDNLWN